jgi:hypothetical protein
MQKPLAQGGVRFLDFHAPPCANFLRFSSAIDFHAATNTLALTARFEFFLNKKIISVELKKTLTVILRSPIF